MYFSTNAALCGSSVIRGSGRITHAYYNCATKAGVGRGALLGDREQRGVWLNDDVVSYYKSGADLRHLEGRVNSGMRVGGVGVGVLPRETERRGRIRGAEDHTISRIGQHASCVGDHPNSHIVSEEMPISARKGENYAAIDW